MVTTNALVTMANSLQYDKSFYIILHKGFKLQFIHPYQLIKTLFH